MSTFDIFILSFIQGLTEFLPISSSGHLILLPKLLGWQDQGLELDVAVHIGTLCSVLLYFRAQIWAMMCDSLRYILSGLAEKCYTPNVHLSLLIIIGTIPAVIFGFILKKVGQDIVRDVRVIAFTSIFFGILLYLADRLVQRLHSVNSLTVGKGLFIGFTQALALIPGTSRSGVCITAGRFLGLDRVLAARFAFLLSIPAIMGAGVLTCLDALKEGTPLLTMDVGYAILFSFAFGLLAIRFMMAYLAKYSLAPFAIYRILLGSGLLMFF
ncbi:undecaprenyl-diphosphate phosphatase [Candidatus Paracaedibacter symbiosus]|uniref:undecaprenyl-diphosphate phosphatase n=1 Tax=Candidatus Paracaedibacter symbiosus TaxID=244582 RepID=UPI000509AB65|nr:undecaprenyl-diphosphate phosphatase [Candidatus Paracaedibacter symbiosus]